MTKLPIAATLVAAGMSVAMLMASSPALAQGYVYVYPGAPTYVAAGYVAPGYAAPLYDYAPGYWRYGSFDESENSVRQPSPSSTIRAVR
ncbi:MAG: hypothetical protein WBE48_23645 [Xanthobacteraceae bacterium]|jgi:hypothetical protein